MYLMLRKVVIYEWICLINLVYIILLIMFTIDDFDNFEVCAVVEKKSESI